MAGAQYSNLRGGSPFASLFRTLGHTGKHSTESANLTRRSARAWLERALELSATNALGDHLNRLLALHEKEVLPPESDDSLGIFSAVIVERDARIAEGAGEFFAVFERVVCNTREKRLWTMLRAFDAAAKLQQFDEYGSGERRSQKHTVVSPKQFAFGCLVFRRVHDADAFECGPGLADAVLVGLEQLSARMREASCADAMAQADKRIVTALIVANENALGVAENIHRDFPSARKCEFVRREAATHECPYKHLRLLGGQLERRLVCMHEIILTDSREKRLSKLHELLRAAAEKSLSVVRKIGMPSRLKSASSR